MDYKELGNRVREARTIYGITQSNLAERVGCSVQHISHIDRRCVKVRKNLRDYEFELAGKGLVRVHAGYMVAMKYCAKIEKGQIVMEDGTEIPISRDRKNMVKEQFMISRRK